VNTFRRFSRNTILKTLERSIIRARTQKRMGQMAVVNVDHDQFHNLIENRGRKLLGIVKSLSQDKPRPKKLVRPVMGELLSQSTQMEEILDAYDARNNSQWSRFRALVAAVKLFADIGYELLHIQHSLPRYQLLPIGHDFAKATREAFAFTEKVLLEVSRQLTSQALELNLTIYPNQAGEELFTEHLPCGRLAHDRQTYRTQTVRETVTLLATAFLNLAAETELLCSDAQTWTEERPYELPESVSEKNLRRLKFMFHSLQSLYDTHVSDTETEGLDRQLPVLRGHISVVFHLLQTATLFAHYYERHICGQLLDASTCVKPLMKPETMLAMLMNYSVIYSTSYIECAQRLCQEMLKRYAQVGRIEVAVPRYRGFHVRPATLIAKLVLHYGSQVRMELDGDMYDPGSPLELFRANEKINAQKRRCLVDEVMRLGLVEVNAEGKDVMDVVRDVVSALAEKSRLILYEQPLQLPQEPVRKEGILLEKVTAELARLQATGKIDVESDLRVTFVGDKRVLADINLLAEGGYGEDNWGNNVTLPHELAYLRK